MGVDDISGEMLEYWSDRAVAKLTSLRRLDPIGYKRDRGWVEFADDVPDPLNDPADTMAVIRDLKINLTCEYTPGGFLIQSRDAWTAQCGWPALRNVKVRGDTQQEAVTRLFVAMVLGRELGEPTEPLRPNPV